MARHRVFVFGTLKQGFPNFSVNKGERVPGAFRTRERFPLYLVGDRHVPWMLDLRGEGERVLGEVYDVDDAALAAMDELERVGEPDGYRRVAIQVEGAGASLEAFAYLKLSPLLVGGEARLGPIEEYTFDHARLYRSRAMSVPVRGMIFGLDSVTADNVAMLRRLRKAGLKLGVVSTSAVLPIAAYRVSLLAGNFDVEVFASEAQFANPQTEVPQACLQALGLGASDCIFVGDGADEFAGAKAVGLRTVFVSGVIAKRSPDRIAPRIAAADHHVEHVWEVERIVAPIVAEVPGG